MCAQDNVTAIARSRLAWPPFAESTLVCDVRRVEKATGIHGSSQQRQAGQSVSPTSSRTECQLRRTQDALGLRRGSMARSLKRQDRDQARSRKQPCKQVVLRFGIPGTLQQGPPLQRPPERNRSEEHTSELQSRPHLVCR